MLFLLFDAVDFFCHFPSKMFAYNKENIANKSFMSLSKKMGITI